MAAGWFNPCYVYIWIYLLLFSIVGADYREKAHYLDVVYFFLINCHLVSSRKAKRPTPWFNDCIAAKIIEN